MQKLAARVTKTKAVTKALLPVVDPANNMPKLVAKVIKMTN